MRYRFGEFDADRAAYRVSRNTVSLDLTPKLLDLLFFLLDRPGQLVTKEELLDGVWPGANVTENAMAQAVSDLREALNDDASAPTYIRTIARRGYRFVAPVEGTAAPARQPQSTVPADDPASAQRALAVADFVNLAGDPEVDWLGAGIAETVTSDLASLGRFRVIDRWRVVEAARLGHDIAAAVGAAYVVSGGFQRRGQQLRVTARLIDVTTGVTIADAKVDGHLEDVFAVQDAITRSFARDLGLPLSQGAGAGVRETGSLEAYRSYIEGWLKIESLDVTLNRAAIKDFAHAIVLDPKYAMAYTGLANAEFIAYESTRMSEAPNFAALRSGIEHARFAIHLDDGLAEAHATLSFLLTSRLQFEDARRSAQQAVALEPESWRHQYRLGHALWGAARLHAFARTLDLYPQFAYARFEMAMVHVARGHFDAASDIVQRGAGDQDRQAQSADRFPAVGFHWLMGAMRAARGDWDAAIQSFDRELEHADSRRLYGSEYASAALVSRGHASLHLDRPDDATEAFRTALEVLPGHPRALLGLALADARLKKPDAGAERAQAAVTELDTPDRQADFLYASACTAAAGNDAPTAAAALTRLLDAFPGSYVGWAIPIEPAFVGIRSDAAFRAVLTRLAERAG